VCVCASRTVCVCACVCVCMSLQHRSWLRFTMLIVTALHRTASYCNTLQHTATGNTHCNILQRIATHCNTLQHIATHCNALQHTATKCITETLEATPPSNSQARQALQHTATHCNTLQHTATHCNTLQPTATHCNTLQHIATHCNTLLTETLGATPPSNSQARQADRNCPWLFAQPRDSYVT